MALMRIGRKNVITTTLPSGGSLENGLSISLGNSLKKQKDKKNAVKAAEASKAALKRLKDMRSLNNEEQWQQK
jgi:hypothetical protein